MKMNLGNYVVFIQKQPQSVPQDDGPTRVEVIVGESPPHWIIRVIRGNKRWDLPNMRMVVPPSQRDALNWAENRLLRIIEGNEKYTEVAIYMLAGMNPQKRINDAAQNPL